jgi:hypothetical protein
MYLTTGEHHQDIHVMIPPLAGLRSQANVDGQIEPELELCSQASVFTLVLWLRPAEPRVLTAALSSFLIFSAPTVVENVQ